MAADDDSQSKSFRQRLNNLFSRAAGALPPDQQKTLQQEVLQLQQEFAAVVARNEALAQRNQTLEKVALIDSLTGLPNRVGMKLDLEGRLARKSRHGAGQIVVAMLDLDGFKAVNDGFGHQTGDKALCRVADRLQAALRKTDTVCRVGGDEMVIVAEYDGNERFNERTLTTKIRGALQDIVYWKGDEPYPIGTSIGYAVLEPEDKTTEDTMENMLMAADAAMYEDKRDGKWQRQEAAKAALRKNACPSTVMHHPV